MHTSQVIYSFLKDFLDFSLVLQKICAKSNGVVAFLFFSLFLFIYLFIFPLKEALGHVSPRCGPSVLKMCPELKVTSLSPGNRK